MSSLRTQARSGEQAKSRERQQNTPKKLDKQKEIVVKSHLFAAGGGSAETQNKLQAAQLFKN
jgi:hypothetical protein